jgi:cysteine desulfurase
MSMPIYLDHAATTPVSPSVLAAMEPYFAGVFANPATLYGPGAEAREAVEHARETTADAIGARPDDCYFTSGGTESDNWAIHGVAMEAAKDGKRHVLVSAIEHHAVLETAEALRGAGFEVEVIPVTAEGVVEPEAVRERLRPDTALVSVMHANNEMGAIQPVAEIGVICREAGVTFHVDAVQTLHQLPVNVRQMNADLLTLSAHKLYGPKGVGLLYIRRGTRIARHHYGGEQERGRRAGTLNVPGIVGFGRATEESLEQREQETVRLSGLRDRLIEGTLGAIPNALLSGPWIDRLPNNVHFCFPGIEGESLLLSLDMQGICASAGAACSSGSTEPSHVLLAMGRDFDLARGALRLTLGRSTTAEDVETVLAILPGVVNELRSLGG